MKTFRDEVIKAEHPAGYSAGEFETAYIGTKTAAGKKGYFSYTYGTGDSVRGALKPVVDMAEDSQAIYEFIQNADDCEASEFHMFYDEKYFLAINNGKPFSKKDVKAILNAGQGTKTQDTTKIGEYGIGFKLIHKLIGAGDGIDEMMFQHKGPIVFSWNDPTTLGNLAESINPEAIVEQDPFWLFKILLTCFPVGYNEEILSLDEQSTVPFDKNELGAFHLNLKSALAKIGDLSSFQTGSVFFLEFGKNKSQNISKHQDEQIQFLEASMGRLSNLKTFTINSRVIKANTAINWTEPIKVELDDLLALSEKKVTPEITFGHAKWNSEVDPALYPTFYKYFACSQEGQRSRFLVDSNAFAISPDRTRLDESDRNIRILEFGTNELIKRIETKRKGEFSAFLDLYSNIIATRKSSKEWQNESFVNVLHDYARSNTPTKTGICRPCTDVVIQDTKLNIDLDKVGIDKDWFYWDKSNENGLLTHARKNSNISPIKLETYSLKEVLQSCKLEKWNDWVGQMNDEQFGLYLQELCTVKKVDGINIDDLYAFRVNGKMFSRKSLVEYPELLEAIYNDNYKWKDATEQLWSRLNLERWFLSLYSERSDFKKSNLFFKVLNSFIYVATLRDLIQSVDEIPLVDDKNHPSLLSIVRFAKRIEEPELDLLLQKTKLFNHQGDFSCELAKATIPETIIMRPKDTSYTLKVSDILPKSDFSNCIALKQRIRAKMEKMSVQDELAGRILDVSTDSGVNLRKQVQNELDLSLTNGLLTNSSQLAFVLLNSRYSSSKIDLSSYKVLSTAGHPIPLSGVNYLPNCGNEKFCEEEYVLSSEYKNLKTILRLDECNGIIHFEGVTVADSPCVDLAKQRFVFEGFKLDSEEDKRVAINYLFSLWSKHNDLALFKNNDLGSIDGFVTNLSGLFWRKDLASSSEQAPAFLEDFVKHDIDWKSSEVSPLGKSFLSAIGTYHDWSDEYKLRECLKHDICQFESISELTPEFIQNTFTWISESGLELHSSEQITMVQQLALQGSIDIDEVLSIKSKQNAAALDNEHFKCLEDLEFYTVPNDVLLDYQYNGHVLFQKATQFYRSENEIYVSDQMSLVEQSKVLDLLQGCGIGSAENLEVIKAMSESIGDSAQRIFELEKENAQLREKSRVVFDSGTESDPFRGGLSTEEMIAVNEEARSFIKEHLSDKLDFVNSDIDSAIGSVVNGVIELETGLEMPLVIKSMKSITTLNLNPNEVLQLQKDNARLLIRRNESRIDNLSFDEIANYDPLFHIQFRVEQFSSETLVKFAETFRFMKDVKFQFDYPQTDYTPLTLDKKFLPNRNEKPANVALNSLLQTSAA